jgi:hypothetical protein
MRLAAVLAIAIVCTAPFEAIAQHGQPNVWIDVSEYLLDGVVERTIDRPEIVKDVILGTPLSGTGTVHAVSDLVIDPHDDHAAFKIIVSGHIDTNTISRSGPARVHSHTVTSFEAEKKLVLDRNGLTVLPADCEASARTIDSRVVPVKGGLSGRIVRRVGQRRWQGLRESAEREVAEHAQQQVMAAVDEEADDLLKQLDRVIVAPMLALAAGQDANPGLRFCSGKGILRIGLILGSSKTASEAPPYDDHRFVTVHVHSSLVEQLSTSGWNKDPGDYFLLARIDPSLAWLDRIGATRRALGMAWRWVDETIDARPTLNGIRLRDGQWGVLVPSGLGREWLSVKWQPAEGERLAGQPSSQAK